MSDFWFLRGSLQLIANFDLRPWTTWQTSRSKVLSAHTDRQTHTHRTDCSTWTTKVVHNAWPRLPKRYVMSSPKLRLPCSTATMFRLRDLTLPHLIAWVSSQLTDYSPLRTYCARLARRI